METFNNNHKFIKPQHQFKTMVVGILIATFGFLFMLHNMDVIDRSTWRLIFSWPMLLVALGIVNLAERKIGWGVALLSVGLLFLADRYYDLPYNLYQLLWPVIIIIVGISIIFSNSFKAFRIRRHRPDVISSNGDLIDEAAVFGGNERSVHSQNFRGGEIVAIFGGTKTDLTQCQLAAGENVLELTAIFGGAELIVPNDWNVKLEMTSIFGGFSDKRRNTSVDFNKTLIIKGTCIFGGGELKSY